MESRTDKGTKERMDSAVKYATIEGIKGSLYGFTAAMLFTLTMNRVSPVFRSITLPGKSILVSIATLGTGIVVSEHAIYAYNRPFLKEQYEKDRLSWFDRVMRYRYVAVAGVIGVSLMVSWILVDRRHPHMSMTQKLLNARLWAQATGLSGIVGAMALGYYASK